MFKCQRMILKSGVAIGHGGVAGVAGLSCKTEISNVQAPQLRRLRFYDRFREPLLVTGMQRQRQKDSQRYGNEQQEL